jgi:hypothetical protein
VTEHRIFLHKKVIEDFLSLFYLFSDSTNSRKMSTKISARTLGSTSVSTPLARGIQVALGIGLTVSIIYVLKLRKQYKQIESPSKSSVKSETIPYDDRVHIPRWLGANFGTSPSPPTLAPILSSSFNHASTVDEPSSPRPRIVSDDVESNVFSMPVNHRGHLTSSPPVHFSSPLRPLKPIALRFHSKLIQEGATPYSPAEH